METRSQRAARTMRRVVRSLVISGIAVAALVLPLAPPGSRWWKIADGINTNFNEEFGWREMTDAVLRVRDSLPRDDAPVGVLADDAGQAAAINLYGRGHGLPEVISRGNSHWLRGYGNPPPKTVIAAGFLRTDLESVFESCELAGHFTIPYGIKSIAIGDGRTDIFVCRRPREPWPVFWKRSHSFG